MVALAAIDTPTQPSNALTLAATARDLAARFGDLAAILPVLGKQPHDGVTALSWAAYQDKPGLHWFPRNPQAITGICVMPVKGSPLVIKDFDTLALYAAFRAQFTRLAASYSVTTGKGVHLYLLIRNAPKFSGITGVLDIRQNGNGIVVGNGSSHWQQDSAGVWRATGRHYVANDAALIDATSEAQAIEAWIEAHKPAKPPPNRAATGQITTPQRDPSKDTIRCVTCYANGALRSAERMIAAAGKGDRNNTLNTQLWAIAELVNGGYLNESEAVIALTDAARAAGLPAGEVDATVNSALKQATARDLGRGLCNRHTSAGMLQPPNASSSVLRTSIPITNEKDDPFCPPIPHAIPDTPCKAATAGVGQGDKVDAATLPLTTPSSLAELSPSIIPEPLLKMIDVLIAAKRPLTNSEWLVLSGLSKATFFRWLRSLTFDDVLATHWWCEAITPFSFTVKSETREKETALVSYEALLEVLRQNVIIPRLYVRLAKKRRVALPQATPLLVKRMSGLPRGVKRAAIAESVNAALDPLLTELERAAQADLWDTAHTEAQKIMNRLADWRGAAIITRRERIRTAALQQRDHNPKGSVNLRQLHEDMGVSVNTIKHDLMGDNPNDPDYFLVPDYNYYPIRSFADVPIEGVKHGYKGKPQRIIMYSINDNEADYIANGKGDPINDADHPEVWRRDGHLCQRDWTPESINAALQGGRRLELECRAESILKDKGNVTAEDRALIESERRAAQIGAKNRADVTRPSKPKYADVVKANYIARVPSLAPTLGVFPHGDTEQIANLPTEPPISGHEQAAKDSSKLPELSDAIAHEESEAKPMHTETERDDHPPTAQPSTVIDSCPTIDAKQHHEAMYAAGKLEVLGMACANRDAVTVDLMSRLRAEQARKNAERRRFTEHHEVKHHGG